MIVDVREPGLGEQDTYPDKPVAMGHWFGEDLCCTGCGVTWKEQQNNPTECEHKPADSNKGGRVLTVDAAREIKHLKETVNITQREMAERFGVSRRAIWNVLNGITWKEAK
jgi:DNA-binding XRE family transcriptional regulator